MHWIKQGLRAPKWHSLVAVEQGRAGGAIIPMPAAVLQPSRPNAPDRVQRRMLGIAVGLTLVPGLALAVVTWVLLWRQSPSPLGDAICVRDYLNMWAAGTLARLGDFDTLFHPLRYAEWLRGQFGPDLPLHTWSYPPTMVLLGVPLSALPVVGGFVAWMAGTLVLLWVVLRRCGLHRALCLAVLLSPAVVENALAGQNGALTAALLEGGLLIVHRRPVLAGLLFGLLTAKPQLGLLVPVCLLASRQWRAVAAAAVSGGLLFGASVLAFGGSSWVWFLGDVRRFMTSEILEQPFGATFQHMLATPFIFVRWLNGPLALAYGVQLLVSASCVVLAWNAWRRPGADPKTRMALTASLGLLTTPYAFSYDAIGTAIGIAVLADQAVASRRWLNLEAILLYSAWAWPGMTFWLGLANMPPVGCFTLMGLAFCAWRRLAVGTATCGAGSAPSGAGTAERE